MVILEKSDRIKKIEDRLNVPLKDLFYQMHWIEDMKHRDIALNLHMPRPTITRWFHYFKVPTQSCRRFTDKNLTSWLYKIGQLKKKPRYQGPDKRIQRTKNRVNVDFFKKWSAEMAYVLGYFCADGGMFLNSGDSKYIHFVSTDYELLRKVRHIIDSKHKIALKRKANKRWKDTYILQIGSKEIYDSLEDLGLTSNKEYRLTLPCVPSRHLRHFVRGYFDGDGCISYGYYKRKNRNNRKAFVFFLRFASGSKPFLRSLSQRLHLCAKIGRGCLTGKGSDYHLGYARNDTIALFHYMYNGIRRSLFLERKYNKFQEIFSIIGAVA